MQKVDWSGPYTASAIVRSPNGVYYGYTINVTTATAAILIRDGQSASGTIIDTIPTGTAAGNLKSFSYGLGTKNGIFIDFNGGTGTVVLHVQ